MVFLCTICNLLHLNISINKLALDLDLKDLNSKLLTIFDTWAVEIWVNWDAEDNEFTLLKMVTFPSSDETQKRSQEQFTLARTLCK